VSCDSNQRQVAQAAGDAGGISQSGSKSAGVAGQAGQVGGRNRDRDKPPPSSPGPRKVRRAVKAYQQLAQVKQEKLRLALTEAALFSSTPAKQRERLAAVTHEFGAGVTAAGLAVEVKRLKKSDRREREKVKALQTVLAQQQSPAAGRQQQASRQAKTKAAAEKLPTQHQIVVGRAFSPEELGQLQTTALLSSVATQRQLEARRLNAARGHLHSDPRAQDWMTQDLNNFRFVSRQLGQARRNGGKLDTAALDEAELLDLWEFSRFEADRALRNVDHLLSGWSHLKGETADYLGGQLRLEARFYSYLAQQLEPRITPELRDKYESWEVG
jgi:hypothetical protein